MHDSAEYRELRNNIWYYTSIKGTMSDHSSTEENLTGISSQNVEEKVPEIQTLTQEAVGEQIRGLIAPLTHQVEDLIRLVQGMVTMKHPDHFPRTDKSTTSGRATHQSDISLTISSSVMLSILHVVRATTIFQISIS